MKELSSDIVRQQEILNTKKYINRKFPTAVLANLVEENKEAYMISDKPETFSNVKFFYSTQHNCFAVRPYLKLKRNNKPTILIYSASVYPCTNSSIQNFLNSVCANKKFSELPNSITCVTGQMNLPIKSANKIDASLNMFSQPVEKRFHISKL